MNTADKLMNLAIDGDTSEDVVVERDDAPPADEIVEETTVTRRVRRERPADEVVIIDED